MTVQEAREEIPKNGMRFYYRIPEKRQKYEKRSADTISAVQLPKSPPTGRRAKDKGSTVVEFWYDKLPEFLELTIAQQKSSGKADCNHVGSWTGKYGSDQESGNNNRDKYRGQENTRQKCR